LAVAVTLATPEASVTADNAESTALAPLAGAPKVTVMPLTGLPHESFTVACNAFAKAEFTAADCGVPPVAARLAACPAALVSENDADTPCTLATML
jgi:hypothetical protein